MSRTQTKTVMFLIAVFMFTATGHPQGLKQKSSKDSFYQALALTKAALKTLTGQNVSGGTDGIHWVGNGQYDISARLQGLNFNRPDMVPISEEFGYDPKSNALLYESKTKVNHDASEWIRYVYDGRGRLLIANPVEKWAIWTSGKGIENQRKGYSRILPQVILSEALKERWTLRYGGTLKIQNEQLDVVNFTPRGSQTISLFFLKKDGLFRGIEYLIDHPLLGDTSVRWLFDEYQKVEGFGMFPYRYKVFLGPRFLKTVRITKVRAEFDASARMKSGNGIKIPNPPALANNGSEPARSETKPEPPIEEIGNNVYLVRNIRGGFHVLVVKFKDYLMVVDTPAGYHELQQIPAVDWAGETNSSAVGQRLFDLLKKRFPNRPVKYVVLTHHHGDHAGGIFPFLNGNTTVLASKETIGVLNQSLERKFKLDSIYKPSGKGFRVVEVGENYRVKDGATEVEIRNVGENPHAEGMLVVYLPKQRLLYQSDLFEPFADGREPSASRLPVMRWFVLWLEKSGLNPEKIFAIHGSAVVTKSQIEKVRRINEARKE